MAYTIGMMNTKTNTTANSHMNFQPRQSALCLLTRASAVCRSASSGRIPTVGCGAAAIV